MLGRLSWSAFPHDAVTRGGALSMVFVLLALVAFVTYQKRWTWLWKDWLTSLDHKKIGLMYVIVAVVMLLRGLADAALMRGQQAVSAGANHGYLDANHFQQIFSAHGTIMIFFVAMGLVFGFVNLLCPCKLARAT